MYYKDKILNGMIEDILGNEENTNILHKATRHIEALIG